MIKRPSHQSDAREVLVFSSDKGRVCPQCGNAVAKCSCHTQTAVQGDGIARVRREVKGRGGKTVTTVSGITGTQEALKQISSELRRRCGTGGTLKDGIIEIQGDHVTVVLAELEKRGITAKRSGG